MKLFFLYLLLFLTACAPELSSPIGETTNNYSHKTKIELYLSTNDPMIENKVIKDLIAHNISNKQIKSILREKSQIENFQYGLQTGLKSRHNGKTYSHALYIPKGEMPKMGLPLIVILHGMGGHGNSTIRQWIPRLNNHFAILCPSYPMAAWWSANAENLILALIRDIKNNYPIDNNRVFLSGLSNGAIGAFWIGMNNPDYFAGIVPIAGGIHERLMHFLVNLRNTPIYIIHGKVDPIFPVTLLRRTKHILMDMNYPAIYREHNETTSAHGGHFMPDSETTPLVNWLEKQKRITFPNVVRMTREENHLKPIHWASITKGKNLAALQMPGPEREHINIKDGKIATMFISRRTQNLFETAVQNVLEYKIYLNPTIVNFNEPIQVSTQKLINLKGRMIPGDKKMSFNRKVNPDPAVLLSEFKKRRDPDLLFDAIIKVSTEHKLARKP